jgi:YVTN family beta-propeller protein
MSHTLSRCSTWPECRCVGWDRRCYSALRLPARPALPTTAVVLVSESGDIATWLKPAASGPDGKVVIVTNKKDQSVSIIDAAIRAEVARIPTSKKVVHGVAYSPDGRLAYTSCESIGADPGAVDQPSGVTVVAAHALARRR